MCFQNYTLFCLVGNILLSISIVILNKLVYVKTEFPNVSLTFLHFVMTEIGLCVCHKLRLFQAKHIPILEVLPLAASFCGFVVFTNLSLGYNTVGTFQILKTLTMPTIMIIQTFFYNQSFSYKVKCTLLPISVGVILNSAYDVKFNVIGTAFALTGVIITSFYQVWVGEKQKELQVNSMQLLYYQAPLSILILFFIIPFIENPWADKGIFTKTYNLDGLGLILLSCLTAFLVNLSIYWIIGNTSAVTYNVVGQIKFSFTLIGGYIIFAELIQPIQFLGILMTLFGVSIYAYFKVQDQKIPVLPFNTVKS